MLLAKNVTLDSLETEEQQDENNKLAIYVALAYSLQHFNCIYFISDSKLMNLQVFNHTLMEIIKIMIVTVITPKPLTRPLQLNLCLINQVEGIVERIFSLHMLSTFLHYTNIL